MPLKPRRRTPPASQAPTSRAGLVLIIAVFALIAAFGLWAAPRAWSLGGTTRMGVHGYVAMALGASLSAALAGALMWLAFYSSRRGYDDERED